jgi:hypothetical protein
MAKRFSYYYLQVNTGQAWETLEQSESVAVLTSGLADQLASPTDAEIRIVGANFDETSERWAYEQLFYIDQSSIDLGIADEVEDEEANTFAAPAFHPDTIPVSTGSADDRMSRDESEIESLQPEPGPAVSALLREREELNDAVAGREQDQDDEAPPWMNAPEDSADEDSAENDGAPPWGGFDDDKDDGGIDNEPMDEKVPWLRAQQPEVSVDTNEPEPFRFDTTPPPRRRFPIGKIIGAIFATLFLAAWVVVGALVYLQHPLILDAADRFGIGSYLRLGSHEDGAEMSTGEGKDTMSTASGTLVEPLTTGQVVRFVGVAPALRGRWAPGKCDTTFIEFDEDGYNRSIDGQAAAEKTEISETLQDDFVYYLRRSPELVEHFRKVTDNDIQLAGATTESGYLGSSGKVEIYSRCP